MGNICDVVGIARRRECDVVKRLDRDTGTGAAATCVCFRQGRLAAATGSGNAGRGTTGRAALAAIRQINSCEKGRDVDCPHE